MRKGKLFKFIYSWRWLMKEGAVLWRSLIDKDTPWVARFAALGVIFYVLSPIDLVPDFIPVFGWIDDLIILPLGMAFVRALVPEDVWMRSGGSPIERRTHKRGSMKNVTPMRR
ncbi:MAG: hypothetical protein DI585_05975 [Pseudomonas fluorescens]|nr:MAG: hypothetical protein DI585_05975 [Pseudomonas fluorescens]